VVVDTTPPVVDGTCPSDGSTYQSLDKITVYCYDTESGIASVTVTIAGAVYTLSYVSKEPQSPYEIWQASISPALSTPGTYSYSITVINNAGLKTTQSGSFTIYTQFQGKWYINNIGITSSSQTIYSIGTTVSFKFQKTAGIDDSKISCWVEEGGMKILTLTLTDSTNHVWTGSYTFTQGKHVLTLKASDGISAVTMSITNLQVGETQKPPQELPQELPHFNTGQLFGFVLIIVGAVLALKKSW
jgi:hypothetical protein